MKACHNWTMLKAELSLIVKYSRLLLSLPAVFRDGSVATRNGHRRYFCGQKEPFAILVSESYAQVRLYRSYYGMALKAFYFTMNNGELTVRLIEWW